MKELKQMLLSFGWSIHGANHKGLLCFVEPGQEKPLEIFLPKDDNCDRVQDYFNDAVRVYAQSTRDVF
jgi:hypothetical protein